MMSHKPDKNQIKESEQLKPDFNSKFVWQEGDLVIEKAFQKPKKTMKKNKK